MKKIILSRIGEKKPDLAKILYHNSMLNPDETVDIRLSNLKKVIDNKCKEKEKENK